jgi:foldase protein PrsA
MPKKTKEKKPLKNVLDLRKKEEQKKEDSTKKEEKSKKRFSWKIMIISILSIILIINGVFAYGIYALGWTNTPTKIFLKIFPYPAGHAGWSLVKVSDFYKDLESYQKYYQVAQGLDINSDEGKETFKTLKEDLMNLLIEEKVVAKEAKKLGIKVEKTEIDAEYDRLAQEQGEETLKKEIEDLYGWDLNTFREKIKSALLREKLTEKIATDDEINKDKKQKAEEVLAKAKAEEDFAKLAKDYSEDPASATEGGDLGWFAKGAMVEEFENVAFSLEKGQISDVVKTQYGYHIIKVTDKKDDQIKASHILIKGADFAEWLEGKKSEYTTRRFLNLDKIQPFSIEIKDEDKLTQ